MTVACTPLRKAYKAIRAEFRKACTDGLNPSTKGLCKALSAVYSPVSVYMYQQA